jgi:hypothetical protein
MQTPGERLHTAVSSDGSGGLLDANSHRWSPACLLSHLWGGGVIVIWMPDQILAYSYVTITKST